MTKLQRVYSAALQAADLLQEIRFVFGREPTRAEVAAIACGLAPQDADSFDRLRIAFVAQRIAQVQPTV